MKTSILIATAALAVSGAAVAEPVTRTTTYDGPKVDATRVAVRNEASGTYSRDATATRASDGATASRAYDRARTDTGVAVSQSATGFVGNTRSYAYERGRTDNGDATSGTAIGRNSETYTLAGQAIRTNTGSTRSQSVTNESGATFYDRNVVALQSDVQFNRNVSLTRAAGFRRPGFGSGRRQ